MTKIKIDHALSFCDAHPHLYRHFLAYCRRYTGKVFASEKDYDEFFEAPLVSAGKEPNLYLRFPKPVWVFDFEDEAEAQDFDAYAQTIIADEVPRLAHMIGQHGSAWGKMHPNEQSDIIHKRLARG